MNSPYRHATALVIGEKAILIEGQSGAGKSRLADRLIAEARARGLFARLVGDDRVGLRAAGGRLLVRPHPGIAGLIERRGVGLEPVEHVAEAVVAGLIALGREPDRMPDADAGRVEIDGVRLPVLQLKSDAGLGDRVHLVFTWLRE